jgi:hypothetical protein
LLLGQAQAADPEAAAAPAIVSDRDPMKIVCRNMRPPTGSRLQGRDRQRVCQTQREWDDQRDEAQAATREVMRGDRTSNDREFIAPGGVSQSSVGSPH